MENHKSLSFVKVLSIVILAALLGGVLWYGWHRHSSQSPAGTNSTLGDQWTLYQSKQYGFQFYYLKDWGEPKVSAITKASNSESRVGSVVSQTGTRYSITFPDIQNGTLLLLTLDSADYTTKSCFKAGQCSTDPAFTKNTVELALKANATSPTNHKLLKNDSQSYARLTYSKSQATLNIARIVNLPKINASAISLSYSLHNPSSACKSDQLATDSSQGCITNTDYSNLNQLSSNFKSL